MGKERRELGLRDEVMGRGTIMIEQHMLDNDNDVRTT